MKSYCWGRVMGRHAGYLILTILCKINSRTSQWPFKLFVDTILFLLSWASPLSLCEEVKGLTTPGSQFLGSCLTAVM